SVRDGNSRIPSCRRGLVPDDGFSRPDHRRLVPVGGIQVGQNRHCAAPDRDAPGGFCAPVPGRDSSYGGQGSRTNPGPAALSGHPMPGFNQGILYSRRWRIFRRATGGLRVEQRPRVWITGPVAETVLGPLREVAEVAIREIAERATVEEMIAGGRGAA